MSKIVHWPQPQCHVIYNTPFTYTNKCTHICACMHTYTHISIAYIYTKTMCVCLYACLLYFSVCACVCFVSVCVESKPSYICSVHCLGITLVYVYSRSKPVIICRPILVFRHFEKLVLWKHHILNVVLNIT